MDVIEAIKTRHSYRGEYLPDPVPREDLVTIMEAGLAAPSGCNMQTTSLVAVDDPEMLVKVSEIIGKKVGATAPAYDLCPDTAPALISWEVFRCSGLFSGYRKYVACYCCSGI